MDNSFMDGVDRSKYIILNHTPCYNRNWKFCKCISNEKHPKLQFPKGKYQPKCNMFEKDKIYICCVDRKNTPYAYVDGRYFTIKQFDKWFKEINDDSIHTIEEARKKYK